MAESKSRFPPLSEEDLNLLLDDKDAKRNADKPEPQTKDTLVDVLKLFYAEARKADGTSYSKSTLSSLRFGLNWLFKASRGFDIFNDSEFTDVNKVFDVKCVDLKRQGLEKVEHKPPICEEDLKKIVRKNSASTKPGTDRTGPDRTGPDHGSDHGSDQGSDQGKKFKIQNSRFNSKIFLSKLH